MSLGMIKDFDAPEAPDSPTASTTSGSLMAARVSQSATKKCWRAGQNSMENLGRKSVGGFIFLFVLCFVVLRFLLVIVENFLPWHSSPCSGDLYVLLTISEHFVIWLLLKYYGTFALLSHKMSWIYDPTWVVPLPRNYVCSRKSQPKPLFATTGKGDNPRNNSI